MGRAWVVLVMVALLLVAPSALAQRVVKCVQPDGSIVYQQTDCGGAAESSAMEVRGQPIMSTRTERRFVVTEDRYGNRVRAWTDVQVPDGPSYTSRELRRVRDRDTGQWTEAWVDTQIPIPQAPAPVYRAPTRAPPLPPRTNPSRSYNPRENYYQPSDRERRSNSAYERARCRTLTTGC